MKIEISEVEDEYVVKYENATNLNLFEAYLSLRVVIEAESGMSIDEVLEQWQTCTGDCND